jgi:hypothetical protein
MKYFFLYKNAKITDFSDSHPLPVAVRGQDSGLGEGARACAVPLIFRICRLPVLLKIVQLMN